jgi:PAS domain S-box-containing protein
VDTPSSLNDLVYEGAARESVLRAAAVIITDLGTGEVLYASRPAELLFAYGPRELRGRCVDDLVPDDARGRHAGHRAAYAACPRPRLMGGGLLLFGRRKDGVPFPVQVSLSDAEVLGRRVAVAVVTDLTAAVEAAARIQAAAGPQQPLQEG